MVDSRLGKPQNLITITMPRTACQSSTSPLTSATSQDRKPWVDLFTAVCFSRLPPTPSFQKGPAVSVSQRLFPLVDLLDLRTRYGGRCLSLLTYKALFPWRCTSPKPPSCVIFFISPTRGMIFILSVLSFCNSSQSRNLTFFFK